MEAASSTRSTSKAVSLSGRSSAEGIRPGDRVRALDGLAGTVAAAPDERVGRSGDFVVRLPGGDLRDAPGAAVISAHGGVVVLSVSVARLVRHAGR